MANYRGPHVAVRQNFQASPAAVAIESLPSVSVGTAYDVYENEFLGDVFGITDTELAWPTDNKVVYSKDVIGEKNYNFYPVRVYANAPSFGNIETPVIERATGVTVLKDQSYKIPGVGADAGSSTARIPYYTAGTASVSASALDIVNIPNGSVVTSGIVSGQKVMATTGSSTWIEIGTVSNNPTDETKVKLSTPIAAPATYTGITIGAATVATRTYPNTVYDASADFIISSVKAGDIIRFKSSAIGASDVVATVRVVINKSTLMINTEALAAPDADTDYYKYKTFAAATGGTVYVDSYSVERLCGFSEDLNSVTSYATGPTITTIAGNTTAIKVNKSSVDTRLGTAPVVGDLFAVVAAVQTPDNTTSPVASQMDHLQLFTIRTITVSGSDYLIGAGEPVTQSSFTVTSGGVAATGDKFLAWRPKVTTGVNSSFRAVRDQEHMVVTRITSQKDITDAYCIGSNIDPRNELAYMLFCEYQMSGGKVVYGVNVDSTSSDLAYEYGSALDQLRAYDVYSHAFGTTDAGVNSIVGAYCDEQSDPYQGHERIAMITYDEDNVYKIGSDSGSTAAHAITLANMSAVGAGIRKGDIVWVYNTATPEAAPLVTTVAQTPSSNVVEVSANIGTISSATFTFFVGSKNDQAVRISAIKYGNRRVKVIWPGWFKATYNGETIEFPPYYIAAAKAGIDSGDLVSQSQTNRTMSLPGLSNFELGTSTYFSKSDLDQIGSGGIDISVQDVRVSQNFKSRHDLTSNMDAVEYREWSITKQVDLAAKTIRASVNPYVGRYNITSQLLRFIRNVLSIAASTLINNTVVSQVTIVSVSRDELIADKINIVLDVTVFVAGNYYDITLNVKS